MEEIAAKTGAKRVMAPAAASCGFAPSAVRRKISSTTTIASSTTKPTAKTSAMMVNKFKLWPQICITKAAPNKDSKMAMSGAKAALKLPSEAMVIPATSKMVMNNVSARSCSERETLIELSPSITTPTPGGNIDCICLICSCSFLATCRILPSGDTPMAIKILGLPFHHEPEALIGNETAELATSPNRTKPLLVSAPKGKAAKAGAEMRSPPVLIGKEDALLYSVPAEATLAALVRL